MQIARHKIKATIFAVLLGAFFNIIPEAALATSDQPSEIRLDFQSSDELKNERIAFDNNINVTHEPIGKSEVGSLIVTNGSTKSKYLSIKCHDFCGNDEGVLISMWVKTRSSPNPNHRCKLLVKCAGNNNNEVTLPLSTIPLDRDKWTLLSGWYYCGHDSRKPSEFKVSIEPGTALAIDDIVLTRSSIAQPADKRSPLLIKGEHIVEGEKRYLLNGINLYGSSDDEKDEVNHAASSITEEDYKDIAAAGFNCVRLALWHKVFREAGGWELLKIHCLWARRNGLRLILDMHSPPGGYQSNSYKGRFWKDPQMQQELIDFWVRAAKEFKTDPVIVAFDLMNEPKPAREQDWLDFAANTLRAVRKASWNRPVIIESSMVQSNDGWSKTSKPFDDSGVIYDTHFYTPWSLTYSGKIPYGQPNDGYGNSILNMDFIKTRLEEDLITFGMKNKVPVNIGEYGISQKALAAGGDKWLADVLSIMNKCGVSRQYFCWCVYGDFGIESGWYRQHPPKRNDKVLKLLNSEIRTKVEEFKE